MTTAQKLAAKLTSAKTLNNNLAKEIESNGGGAVGMTATFFVNASKDLAKIERQIKNALNNGEISIEEYKSITA